MRSELGATNHDVDLHELAERMLVVEAVETQRCLDEGVLTSVADANVGSVLGIGFPPWTGGVVQYVEGFPGGVAGFVARADALAERYGERFRVPASLRAAPPGHRLIRPTPVTSGLTGVVVRAGRWISGRIGHPGEVAQWVFSIVDRLGEIGVGLLIFLENLIPPVPSEVILPLAGFRASTGALNVWLVWPAATLGSVLGALVLYGLGAWLGYDRLRALAGKRWFFVTSQKDLDRGERIFCRHGGKMVLFGRCVPLIRSVVSIPAGIERMPLPRFLLLTTIGSGVWNAIFIGLGWMLGDHWDRVQGWLGPVSYVVLGLVVVGLIWLAVRKARERSRATADAGSR